MAAPIRIAKPPGVLPVANASTQPSINGANPAVSASSGPRQPATRLKVIIRRLAPGLTQGEFEGALGDEWKVGGGKVSWAKYIPGKRSKDPAKQSKPSRAYLQLTSADHLPILSQHVAATKFPDLANTSDDSCLIGPPVLEFAPYSRIPSSKKRNDARQGTIDTDPEFIAFLESLTQVVVKPSAVDTASGDAQTTSGEKAEEEKIVTPLIKHLRDKKAAKEKAASAKASAKHSKGSKAEATAENKSESKAGKEVADKKPRSTTKKEKVVTKENAKKILKTEDPSTTSTKTQQENAEPKRGNTKLQRDAPASRRTESGRPSGRGSAAAALIQRDLGLRGGRGGATSSRATGDRSKGTKSEATNSASKQATASNTNTTPATQAPSPAVATAKSPKPAAATPSVPATQPPGQAPSRKTTITPGATSAFLKHANPSQGITEPLIQTAMSAYGVVNKVELDKRKGFAYVDFETSDALKAAVDAGSVKIAEGAVVVMERRERPPAGPGTKPSASTASRGNRGGTASQSGRGGSTAQTAAAAPVPTAVEANSAETNASTAPSTAPTTETQAAQPPTGPASASRGRGGRGSGFRGRGGRGRGRGSSSGASGTPAGPAPAAGDT